MADTAGQADIRGINIDTVVKGFADEESIFRNFVNKEDTNARLVRWFQKTSGFLDSSDTSGITASKVINTQLGQPVVIRQSWTRNESSVQKYICESEMLSIEDIKDNDVGVLMTMMRDLTRAVVNQEDIQIWDTLTESRSVVNILSVTTTSVGGDQWDAASGLDPIKDIMRAKRLIRAQGYNPEGGVLFVSPTDHESLLVYLISTKGSSIPSFASAKVETGVVMELLGLRVVVSQNVTADYALVCVPERACTLKTFVPITARTIEDVGLGTKIRVWVESIAVLTDPKASCLIIDTQT